MIVAYWSSQRSHLRENCRTASCVNVNQTDNMLSSYRYPQLILLAKPRFLCRSDFSAETSWHVAGGQHFPSLTNRDYNCLVCHIISWQLYIAVVCFSRSKMLLKSSFPLLLPVFKFSGEAIKFLAIELQKSVDNELCGVCGEACSDFTDPHMRGLSNLGVFTA